jgi:DMSO/TMAO reductase YedYZ molybdopterin-dependent catalytic subunit
MTDSTRFAAADQPYVRKPTPAEFFTYRGPGAREMNWGELSVADAVVATERFYVHNRQPPPEIDIAAWQLTVAGPAPSQTHSFSYDDLRALPAVTLIRAMDCGSNGRRFFPKLAPHPDAAQWLPVAGSAWRFGAMGAATWTGVRLADVLNAAGVDAAAAVDVQVTSLDSSQYSHVVPAARAYAADSLVAYAMNEEPLLPDHGYPCRAFFSGWGGNANVKWLSRIAVSATPLPLPPAQLMQRLIGPDYPEPRMVTMQNVKSAFELDWDATLALPGDGVIDLRGRAWSGVGRIVQVEVQVEQLDAAGAWQPVWDPSWRAATLDLASPAAEAWVPFTVRWTEAKVGYYRLMARATDETGATQPPPEAVPWNQYGLLYNGHVGHPVTIVPPHGAE